MENYKNSEQPNVNSINNIYNQNINIQNKILRSKSKNIYSQQKQNNKPKINFNAYAKPKLPKKTNNFHKNEINIINIISNNNNKIKRSNNNYKKDNNIKKNDINLLKKLKEENEILKKENEAQDQRLKELHNLFIHNYNKIKSLRKAYERLKRYLHHSLIDDNNENLIKEKMEEQFALRMVEQQIIDEICPNPDKMSYEQLLQLEEEVGNVNKGMSQDKINKIPLKPYHKALFEDNCQCIICMENFNENELVKQLSCGHIFHGDCIDHWLSQQKNCPFCKEECVNYQ